MPIMALSTGSLHTHGIVRMGRLLESVALAHAMGAGVVVAHLTLDTTRLGT